MSSINMQGKRLVSQLPEACFASCHESELSLTMDCADRSSDSPSARRANISKQKTHCEIISAKQELLNSKIRCFMLRAPKPAKVSREAATCTLGYTARHSKVTIRPFTSPEDLAVRTNSVKGQERESKGFTVVTFKKNSASFKTTPYLPQRQKWSREVERTQLQGLGTESSRALVGGSLCYTDTSNWCSSPSPRYTSLTAFTEDEEEQFTLSESVGKMVCQQLDHGNVVRVCTSRYRRNEEFSVVDGDREERSVGDEASAELAPLSFVDELERKGAKILTPRSQSAYTPLPIVSETYPVLCSGDEYKHRPFSSSGFHTLGPSQRHTNRKTIYSAIVHITESLQAEAIEKKRRERQREERLETVALQNKVSQTPTGGLRVLPTDKNATKGTELVSGCRKMFSTFPATPPPTGRSPLEFLKAPSLALTVSPIQRYGSSKAVGLVVNGVNPNEAEIPVCPQKSLTPLVTGSKKSLTQPICNNIHKGPTNTQSNKRNFLFISKFQTNNMMNMRQIVSSKQQPNKRSQSHTVAFGAVGDCLHRATNSPFDPERAINIPTAENVP